MPQILAYLGNRNTKNDRYMAIVIRDSGTVKYYLAFTDNLGSILSVTDENGTKVFDASYDAWGKQTVTLNTIGLRLNNPLKYTDPSGDFWNLIIGAAIGGVFNWASHGFQLNAKGLGYFATGAVAGAVGAGLASGVNVAMAGGNFWTGRGYFDTTGAMAYQGCKPKEFKIGDKIKAKYVGRFEGQRVFESKYLGSLSSGEYAAFTLPDIGIFAGEGVFSSSQINGLVMMQHEFGHVLQYRKVGIDFYYEVIAKESAMNCNNFFNILHMKKISIVVKIVLMLLILDIFSSCIMDRKTTLYIKNCTKDTLLIELSEADTLVNWQFWGKQAADVVSPNDTDEVDIAFNKAIIGSFALPDSTIYIDPYIYSHYDTCYLYTIKWNIAKKYSMDEIRAKKLYDRRTVTKKNFHNRLFEYKK